MDVMVTSFWSDLPELIKILGIALSAYFTVLLILSSWLRKFIKKSIKYHFGKH